MDRFVPSLAPKLAEGSRFQDGVVPHGLNVTAREQSCHKMQTMGTGGEMTLKEYGKAKIVPKLSETEDC